MMLIDRSNGGAVRHDPVGILFNWLTPVEMNRVHDKCLYSLSNVLTQTIVVSDFLSRIKGGLLEEEGNQECV